MNEFKKNIFKKSTSDSVTPPVQTITPIITQSLCETTCEVSIVTSEPVVVVFTKALQGGALLVPPSIISSNLVITDNFSETISSNKGYIFEIDSRLDTTQNYFRSSVLIQLLKPVTLEIISQETVQRYHTDAKC